jgi:hypothetical protein
VLVDLANWLRVQQQPLYLRRRHGSGYQGKKCLNNLYCLNQLGSQVNLPAVMVTDSWPLDTLLIEVDTNSLIFCQVSLHMAEAREWSLWIFAVENTAIDASEVNLPKVLSTISFHATSKAGFCYLLVRFQVISS